MSDEPAVTDPQTPPAGDAPATPPGGGPGTPPTAPPVDESSAPPVSQGDRWQDKFLSEELRNREELARFADPEALAKGYLETREFARSRIALPKEGDADSLAAFVEKLRPEKADDYDLPVPEGQAGEFAEAMKPILHKAGLHPDQAKVVAQEYNQYQADRLSQLEQQGRNHVHGYELEIGTPAFNQRMTAIDNMFRNMGIQVDDIVPAIAAVSGDEGKVIRGLAKMAEMTGELAKVSGETAAARFGNMSAKDAQARIDEKMNDGEFMTKAKVKGSPEAKEWADLNRAASKKS